MASGRIVVTVERRKPLRCWLGWHDWRRRVRTIGVIPPPAPMRPGTYDVFCHNRPPDPAYTMRRDPAPSRPPLPPPREVVEGEIPRRVLPDPIPFRERFEQCFGCDKTRRGWTYNAKLDNCDPEPMPWNVEP